MAPPLLTLQGIELTFGGTPLLEGADISIFERDRLCLVGRNGSGKSTLLKIAAGLVDADRGERFVNPGTTVEYLEQEPDLSVFSSVLDYVEDGHAPEGTTHRALTLLEYLGLSGDEKPGNLSGGELRRVVLARALAREPDILLLDEPTNHLDLPAIEWLEGTLSRLNSAIVLISHDRSFLKALSRRTIWIDRGQTRALDLGFEAFEPWRDKILEQEEIDRHKLDRKIHRENHWLTYGVTARRKRNQKRLGDLYNLRDERKRLAARANKTFQTKTITASEAEVSGKLVIEAANISKSWDGQPVVSGFSVKIKRGDRVAFAGPNGVGKTTLIKLLTGEIEPDRGNVKLGTKLEIVSLDQQRESLPPATNLRDALSGDSSDMVMVGNAQRHVMSYMKDFLFQPEQARTPIETLSGGERGRLMLARAFAKPSNLMVLDEPTNDLDLETLDLLQEMLSDYQGTVLLVSHDRDFIDRVVTSVIASDGGGNWISYAGGYSDMQAQKRSTPGGQEVKTKADRKAKKPGSEKSAAASETSQQKPRKLTFRDQHSLKILPERIAELQGEATTLHSRLEDPDFYSSDPQGFDETAKTLARVEAELSGCEDEWLRIEMLLEEFENK